MRRKRPKTIPGIFGQPVRVDSLPAFDKTDGRPAAPTTPRVPDVDQRIAKKFNPRHTPPLFGDDKP